MGLSRLAHLSSTTSGARRTRFGTKKPRQLTARLARVLLPALCRHTQGKPFRPQVFRAWLRLRLHSKEWHVPSVDESGKILKSLARNRSTSATPHGAWKPHGVRYIDQEGSSSVSNLRGFQKTLRGGQVHVSWHEYGSIFRLRKSEPASRGTFEVVSVSAYKRITCAVSKRTLQIQRAGERVEFKNSLVLDLGRSSLGSAVQPWSFVYLHSFSNRGFDYMDFPHYFGVGGTQLRVILPTAPMQEQTCFQDWMVWKGERLQWRRIKFNSWFDYLTDKAGTGENHICIKSLLDMRERIHALIRREVQRVGGDPKRVIVGGASQGCCLALDAAMTYPEELGGVVGLVGHLLGSTPLDPTKKHMPLHLFHEASDREMPWKWVKGTVQRLIDEGFNVTSKREADPSGSGHWIQDIEGAWIRSALRRIIFSHGVGL